MEKSRSRKALGNRIWKKTLVESSEHPVHIELVLHLIIPYYRTLSVDFYGLPLNFPTIHTQSCFYSSQLLFITQQMHRNKFYIDLFFFLFFFSNFPGKRGYQVLYSLQSPWYKTRISRRC